MNTYWLTSDRIRELFIKNRLWMHLDIKKTVMFKDDKGDWYYTSNTYEECKRAFSSELPI